MADRQGIYVNSFAVRPIFSSVAEHPFRFRSGVFPALLLERLSRSLS